MRILEQDKSITLGTDPELFVRNADDEIVGAETFIPQTGLSSSVGSVVIDGVQVELHPRESTCREFLAGHIKGCLLLMDSYAKAKGLKADFSQMVEIKKERLDEMLDDNKKFGCSESMNTYKLGKNKTTSISADPLVYLKRSAGGHIHMSAIEKLSVNTYSLAGAYKSTKTKVNPVFTVLKNPDVLVPMLDILVGNTAVLLDRHEGNIERRKNYGKAGEYRLPTYGIEYRTLSNFWLRGQALMSLMFGLARQAVNMVEQSDKKNNYVKGLMSLVDMKDIVNAINNNDFDLALSNFKKIEKFLLEITPKETHGNYGHYPITSQNIKHFYFLVEKGIDTFFPVDAMNTWITPAFGYGGGYNSFINTIIAPLL